MKLEVKELSLFYQDGEKKREIFSDVNFSVGANEKVVILGPSGTGKSSLLYLISGLRKPTSGKIVYNGKDMLDEQTTLSLRYTDFGFVFQQHYLIPYLNILDNICIARRDQNLKDYAMELLSFMGMESMAYKRPFELSGGEKQRVAIARAIVKKPKVIFADEPTASLDSETAKIVYELIKRFSKDCALVLATHDIHILEGDERILSIENRRVVERVQGL